MIKLRDLLSEVVYKYKGSNGSWFYEDFEGNSIFVELLEDTKLNRLELETYANTGNGKKYKGIRTNSKNIGNRGETTVEIFEREVIPYFKKQDDYETLCIQPIDERRDTFFQKMVRKFETGNYKIIKMVPGLILITKLGKIK